jgi:hypothetical protein
MNAMTYCITFLKQSDDGMNSHFLGPEYGLAGTAEPFSAQYPLSI